MFSYGMWVSRDRRWHRVIYIKKKKLILFKSFVYVAVTNSYTGHQDLVSSFPFVLKRLLDLDLEHDLEEISNVSEELDPGETWVEEGEEG